jgi:DNA-binding GntR family transcriptional regulator
MRTDNAGNAASGALTTGAPEAAAPFSQLLQLKRSGPEPLYYQLAQSLERAIANGTLSRGTRLLPDSDMAKELKLAIGTVRSAWAYLERRGVLTRQRQAGTFIR